MEIKKGVNITSNVIAELTGKRHDNVIRDIEEIVEQLKSDTSNMRSDIFQTTYENRGKNYKNYTLSQDGMMLLITGYSVTHRMKLIKYCRELENKVLIPSYQIDDPIARAKAWITEQEDHNNKIAMKDQIILECKTKVDYYDTILGSDGLLTITQIAKDYGLSGQALNKILNEEKIQYKQSGQWLLYDKHTRKGYTESETIPYFDKGVKKFKLNTKWKQKGRLMIHGLLEKRDIKANMDQENV